MKHQDIRELLLEADSIELERLRMRQPQAWRELQLKLENQDPWFEGFLAWKWAGIGSLGAACALVLVMTTFTQQTASGIESLRVARPGISASDFYSPQADADVIWLSGLPMSADTPSK